LPWKNPVVAMDNNLNDGVNIFFVSAILKILAHRMPRGKIGVQNSGTFKIKC
jgi:hypothetical protein